MEKGMFEVKLDVGELGKLADIFHSRVEEEVRGLVSEAYDKARKTPAPEMEDFCAEYTGKVMELVSSDDVALLHKFRHKFRPIPPILPPRRGEG